MIKKVKISYVSPKVTVASFRVEDAMVSLSGTTSAFGGSEIWLEATTSGSNAPNPDGGYFGNSSFSNISWD